MKASDLIATVSDQLNRPKTVVTAVMRSLHDNILAALARGEDVKIDQWGTYRVKNRAPRKGRNPRTGETMPVGARKIVTFKPGVVVERAIDPGIVDAC